MSDIQSRIDRAVAASREAFEPWSSASLDERIALLHRFADELRRRKSDLLEVICEETGKPRWESAGEVDSMIGKIDLSIRAQAERRSPMESQSAGIRLATRYKPHGVLAVLGPFNFPGHLPNGHIVPAVLAGNAIVFKPSELTPRTAELTLDCWQAAAMPAGLISIVQGGPDIGQALVSHGDIDGVLFTGSFVAGRAINRALADQPGKLLALEMGGNNPLIVHRVDDLSAAALATIQSAYISAGQRCSCARRLILIDGADADAFVRELRSMIEHIRVGLYTDEPQPFMGPVISAAAAERLLAAQNTLIARGAKSIVAMQSLRGIANLLSPGLIDVTSLSQRDDDELFGPMLQVIRVRDFDAAIEEANHTRYGLAAGLFSDDRSLYEIFFRRVKAGVINFNRPLTGASSALAFGGLKDSGNHRPGAFFAADYASDPVASMESDRLVMPATLPIGIAP